MFKTQEDMSVLMQFKITPSLILLCLCPWYFALVHCDLDCCCHVVRDNGGMIVKH